MICSITWGYSRVFLPCQGTVVRFLLLQLDRIQDFCAWLRSSICWQKRFWWIFTNNYIFLPSSRASVLISLSLLQIILLWLRILSLLARSFHGSLQSALRRHALRIWILSRIWQTQLRRNMLIVHYLFLVLIKLLAWNVHPSILLRLIILIESDSMRLPEVRLWSLSMPWLLLAISIIKS